jgi:hypothetical protein
MEIHGSSFFKPAEGGTMLVFGQTVMLEHLIKFRYRSQWW